MTLVDQVYGFYTRRLRSEVAAAGRLPAHVGLVMDGNRRWARQMGLDNPVWAIASALSTSTMS